MNSSENKKADNLTAEQFVEKLRRALKQDGDFPASAKVVNELRQLTSDPNSTANQITEIILREPSLGTRVLSLVNSSFYRRAKPVMTVSQAVIQIGMKPLAELCAGLILMQKFVPLARKGGAFATCLQKAIITSLLSSAITESTSAKSGRGKSDELGYLAGSFAEMGTLLLAFYFPEIYENAVKRSEQKGQSLNKSLKELTGLSPSQLSLEVIDSLELPDFYKDTVIMSEQVTSSSSEHLLPIEQAKIIRIAKSLSAAKSISEAIISSKKANELEEVLSDVSRALAIDPTSLNESLTALSLSFNSHCGSLDLDLPDLPAFVATISLGEQPASEHTEQTSPDETNQFSSFVDEIKTSVENGEPTASIVTTVMETLAWGLGFDRVLLLLLGSGKKKLHGRMLLGNIKDFDPKSYERSLEKSGETYAPDIKAFYESRPVFHGDPLLNDGWPIAAIPIGFGSNTIGVIYADRSAGDSATELSLKEQACIGILAELLDRSVQKK
jgi:HD-like signal output (HDOD) protein